MTPTVDIILTTYNRLGLFLATWHSFAKHTDLTRVGKIIVSDDGSTDGTSFELAILEKEHPQIVVLPRQEERLGLIPRFNMALELCTAPIVCEFQDDVQFFPGWLDKQLAVIDEADFITGYDGREHMAFGEKAGYKVKHSAGFIQLTAKRTTWDRWFPMTPRHEFPTPTVHNGRPIGSGIDTRIYNGRKNNHEGTVTYLVVPGLVHKAHNLGSTWRPDISEHREKFAFATPGGLTADNIEAYWRGRYARQNVAAVGFGNRPPAEQARILKEKQDFIAPWLDPQLTTLDYGCGAGKMSRLFNPDKYLGVDLTPEFLTIARQDNPAYQYKALASPVGHTHEPWTGWAFEQFFTSNVLQHNSDKLVVEIFRNLAAIRPHSFAMVLYENTNFSSNTTHMRFRRPDEYIAFIEEQFEVHDVATDSHRVHGEHHTIMRVLV
jgi:glycosyltransferase involved in cell wall biosynthesis